MHMGRPWRLCCVARAPAAVFPASVLCHYIQRTESMQSRLCDRDKGGEGGSTAERTHSRTQHTHEPGPIRPHCSHNQRRQRCRRTEVIAAVHCCGGTALHHADQVKKTWIYGAVAVQWCSGHATGWLQFHRDAFLEQVQWQCNSAMPRSGAARGAALLRWWQIICSLLTLSPAPMLTSTTHTCKDPAL